MRVVSYNILNGGTDRALLLQDVVIAQRPDLLALVEADDPTTVERMAKRLEMDFVLALGAAHGCALLSRFPIRDSANHGLLEPRLTRSFLQASIELQDGERWTIGVLHLPAHATDADEQKRLGELQVILRLMQRSPGPQLLCGDFNSNAPYQRIDIDRCKPRTQEAWKTNGGHLPRQVITRVLDAGYFDTFRALHDEERGVVGSFDTTHPGQRVDYIFGHGFDASRVQEAWVYRQGRAKDASDHFPLGIELT